MAHTTCCHCVPPGNLRTTEGTRRAGLCEDIFSVTASREVSEDEPRAGGVEVSVLGQGCEALVTQYGDLVIVAQP